MEVAVHATVVELDVRVTRVFGDGRRTWFGVVLASSDLTNPRASGFTVELDETHGDGEVRVGGSRSGGERRRTWRSSDLLVSSKRRGTWYNPRSRALVVEGLDGLDKTKGYSAKPCSSEVDDSGSRINTVWLYLTGPVVACERRITESWGVQV